MTAAYSEELLRTYPSIKQVWLIGSRADGSARPSSDWDYVVMADHSTLDALSAAPRFNDPAVDLLVVCDGDHFRKPWPDGDREKHGSLTGWDWQETSESKATYKATKPRDDDDFYSWIKQGRTALVYPATA
jgi:Polymerase beta, Nucleotidyltransferase